MILTFTFNCCGSNFPLGKGRAFGIISRPTKKPKSTIVLSATNPSVKILLWKDTPSFTLVRNHTCAHSVTIQPIKLVIFESTFWNTLGWNHIIATNVNFPQLTPAIWRCTKEPTLVKNLTDAQHVDFPALQPLTWNNTWWGSIQEKNLTNATSAIMPALLQVTCKVTWEITMDWDLSIATNAIQDSNGGHLFRSTPKLKL